MSFVGRHSEQRTPIDGPGYRARLIAAGVLVTIESRPTLRLDDAGRAASVRDMAAYHRDPFT